MYRIFNVAIDSELALPELPEFDPVAGTPVYRFSVLGREAIISRPTTIDWFHDWLDAHGNVTIRAGRTGSQHWLRFPNLADIAVDHAARQITAFPEGRVNEATLRHLLLDQVIPRVLGQEGALVLHAGAVQLDNGKTIAFVGQTGWGKSTLVSSFEQNGARLITDDCMLLLSSDVGVRAIPNYPGVRLFGDSIRAVYGEQAAVTEVAHYTSKQRVVRPDKSVQPSNEAEALEALFLLGDPAESNDGHVEIRPAAGADALMTIVGQSFLLDNTDKALMANLFHATGAMLRGNLDCFELSYPRDHGRLDELRKTIREAVT